MVVERRVALITGAGRGLGAELAWAFHRAGYALLLHAYRSANLLDDLLLRIRNDSGVCQSVIADLQDPSAPEKLVAWAQNAFSKLDVLINNASTFPDKELRRSTHDLLNETLACWEESLAINARAPFFLMQRAYPLLVQSSLPGGGCIINLLDESVSTPFLSRATHSISKSALAAASLLAEQSFRGKVRVFAPILPTIEPDEIPPLVERIVQLPDSVSG